MKRTAFKIAASTIIVSMTMVACTAQSVAMRRPGSTSAEDGRSDREAARMHERAVRALRQGQLPQALEAMENTVALAPRDAGYRLLLADLYMKSGRFESARASFADVLELDPANVRGGLSLALMQISLGRPHAAVALLDDLSGRASAADLGLAYALAGMPERAIEILEPAARTLNATARLRQNLALSYALAGDWQRARAVASQDVSSADLGARLQQWAAMASNPSGGAVQVASLLGVTPVQDPGQPVRLALAPPAPAPAAEAFAQADFAEYPTYEAPVAAPAYAEAAPAADSDWGLTASEAAAYDSAGSSEADVEQVRFAAAAESLTRPSPALVRTASAPLPRPLFERASPVGEVRRGESPFVVQLGAFSNEANAERAWQQAEGRFGLGDHAPLTTTIEINGRTLHRVSVAGFASRADAAQMCGAIRAQGGACFVRANAGDASVRWAARYAQDRDRNA